MNRDRVEGSWKQFSGMLKEQWGKLTHNESGVEAGKHDRRAGRIQARLGHSKDEIERQISDFQQRNRNWNSSGR